MFPTDDLSTQTLGECSARVACDIDSRYLEYPVRISLVRPETFDGDGELEVRVLPIVHFCESTIVMNGSDTYEFPCENVGGWNNPA